MVVYSPVYRLITVIDTLVLEHFFINFYIKSLNYNHWQHFCFNISRLCLYTRLVFRNRINSFQINRPIAPVDFLSRAKIFRISLNFSEIVCANFKNQLAVSNFEWLNITIMLCDTKNQLLAQFYNSTIKIFQINYPNQIYKRSLKLVNT